MKKILTLAAALLSFGLFAETERLEILNDNSFKTVTNYWCANDGQMKRKPGGKIFKGATGGRSGSCMRITCTDSGVASLFSRALIPFTHATDTIKCSIWVKGKGSFQFGFYLYAEKGRGFRGMYYAPKITVNSKEYKKYDFVFPCSKFAAKAKTARLSIGVSKAADLYFDDFTGVKETIVK